ncbi:DUF222 domain-containing protein [Saxibacter everestensis]|uniref:DUF222 domain-containing protein n=1 Tax=Saxibacter everestensis TaxID=2909229 RepID=A0ABY8QXG2_9MICO|nr:DUF222 domain-containing protein [Brevibacteriaceae bacterium ZFBP1038]
MDSNRESHTDDMVERANGVAAAVGAVFSSGELARAGDREVLAIADAVEAASRRLGALQVQLAGEIESRSIADRRGQRGTVPLLRDRLRITASEAKRRLDVAAATATQRSLTGTPLAPACPSTAGALHDGRLSIDAAKVLAEKLSVIREKAETADDDILAGRAPAEITAQAEEYLVAQAEGYDPGFVAQCGARWITLLDPDGVRPSAAEIRLEHGLWFGTPRRNGLVPFRGAMTQIQHETLLSAAGPATSPRHRNGSDEECQPGRTNEQSVAFKPGAEGTVGADGVRPGAVGGVVQQASGSEPVVGGGQPNAVGGPAPVGGTTDGGVGETAPAGECQPEGRVGETAPASGADTGVATTVCCEPDMGGDAADAGGEDQRTYQHKLLDELIACCSTALKSGTVGGSDATIMVSIDYETLYEKASGHGLLSHTGPIGVSTVRRLACDAAMIPVVLGGAGQVLDVGTARRLFTPAQRRAIIARDGGCIMPGCTAPPSWCIVHHVDFHSEGGPTSIANGALLCDHDHGVIHAGDWTVIMQEGIPWVIPPRWVDPRRTPRRNHYHRPPPLE